MAARRGLKIAPVSALVETRVPTDEDLFDSVFAAIYPACMSS